MWRAGCLEGPGSGRVDRRGHWVSPWLPFAAGRYEVAFRSSPSEVRILAIEGYIWDVKRAPVVQGREKLRGSLGESQASLSGRREICGIGKSSIQSGGDFPA